MNVSQSRREFMVHSSQAAAVLAVAGGASGAFSAVATTSVAPASADLLHALGSRIGLEVASTIGDAGMPLTMSYLDCAGPSVDALRAGIEQGVQWHSGVSPACVESQRPNASVLGVALISNAVTGRSAQVEIETTALSMIALIESVNTPASAHKNAILTANTDSLYRISYVS